MASLDTVRDGTTRGAKGCAGGGHAVEPIPFIRLHTDSLTVDVGDGLAPEYREIEAPVLSLGFDYGGVRVSSSDPAPRVYAAAGRGARPVERDREVEGHARRVLESFGAVEIACIDDMATLPGSEADYLVSLDSSADAACTFASYAVPQLRTLGWRVEVDDNYKWQAVDAPSTWYAELSESDDDWFGLELGVEIAGERINLMPALLELLEQSHARSLSALARSWRRVVALPVGQNRFVTVPSERLRVLLQVLRDLYDADAAARAQLAIPPLQAGALGVLDELLGSGGGRVDWSGAAHLLDRGRQLRLRASAADVEPPRALRAVLRPYQMQGLAFLQGLVDNEVGGILADDMGLGKTLQTIAHLLSEKNSGRAQNASLVVVPTSLVGNWRRELRRFAPSLRCVILHGSERFRRMSEVDGADVVITTYPLLVRDIDRLTGRRFHLLILDEAQTIKNRASRAHRAVRQVEAAHRLCLSGTPLENNLGELWSLIDLLVPGLLGDADQFGRRFRRPIEREGAEEPLEDLRRRVQPFVLRRTKEEVAKELPQKTEVIRPVILSGEQRELYESIRIAAHDRVRAAIRKKGLAASSVTILNALTKLRQVCCDPRLVGVSRAREVSQSAKLELFTELLPTLLGQGRRVLVFSQFARMLALLSAELDQRRIAHTMLTGATRDRQQVIDQFQRGDADVFLISLKAGGTGLNLVGADTVIHYDPWWNPAAQAQATDRAHRIGQTRPVFVYRLIVAGSVEERMVRLQRRKRQLAESILGGGGARFDLTDEDVNDLFAPLRG